MYSALDPGSIHLSPPNLDAAIALATAGGFEGLQINPGEVADLVAKEGETAVRERFDRAGLRAAGFGLPFDFRAKDYDEEASLHALRRMAKAAKAIGANRCFTYILPGSDAMNADQNMDFHVERLGPIAETLHDQGVLFGLEFVGPRTLRDTYRYPFVYTMRAMLSMAASLGAGTGLLLDAFHLFTSGGTLDELEKVSRSRIVYVHINDARPGLTMDTVQDGERELPGATGVLDLSGFLGTLKAIGYEGPVVAEPFDARLKELGDEERARKTGEAVNAALALVETGSRG